MSTDPTLKPDRTADWYMDVVWPLLPVPGEFDGMDACDQFRWRSVVRLAIEYVLCGERGTPPSSKTPHCPKGDGPCIRGCKNWECRDGWPDDPTLKPDIAALKKRLAEDPGFAAQVTGVQWDPLDDDGDALRLAATLRLTVGDEDQSVRSMAFAYARHRQDLPHCYEPSQLDPAAAYRRAIVRAAAAMAGE